MKQKDSFHTLKGYQLLEGMELTYAMEDYLEMVCRILQDNKEVRIRDLSQRLNVKPSSSSKMVQQLSSQGYLKAEKYGTITLTAQGREAGRYLLYRHEVIHKFLCMINQSENELEEVEKIEHFLSRRTVDNLEKFLHSRG